MAFKKNIKAYLIIIALIGVLAIVYGGDQLATRGIGIPTAYLVPTYGHAECSVVIPRDSPSTIFPNINDGFKFTDNMELTCGIKGKRENNAPIYTDLCDVRVAQTPKYAVYGFMPSVSLCNLDGTSCQKQKIPTTIPKTFTSIVKIKPDQKLILHNTVSSRLGVSMYQITGNAYGIRTVTGTGQLLKNYEGCSVSRLSDDYKLKSEQGIAYTQSGKVSIPGGVLPFNAYINWIEGATPMYDSARILSGSIVGISGEIYVSDVGQYMKVIDSTVSNIKVVDQRNVYPSNKLECIPLTPNCDSNAKKTGQIISPGEKCSVFRGAPPGWQYYDGGITACKLTCNSATGLTEKGDCKAVPKCDTSKGEYLDATNLACISSGIIPSNNGDNTLLYAVIIIGVVFILITVTIVVLLGGRRRR